MAIVGGVIFLLPVILLYALRTNSNPSARLRSVAESITIWGAGILVCTELLSRLGWFQRVPVTIAYVTAIAVLAVVAARRRAFMVPRLTTGQPLLLALIFVVCVSTLVVAVVSAPNNLDSQVYHLPRVLQWVQAGSVDHFVTGSDWQTGYPPFGEYLVANLRLLVHGDQLAALPQWIAYVISSVMVAWITRALGGDERAAIISAAVALGTLAAVAESATTQMDLAGAMWALVVVGFAVNRCQPAWIGIALGLSVITKTTALLFVWPFLIVWFVGTCRASLKRGLIGGVVAAACTLVTIAPYAIRNLRTFSSLEAGAGGLANEDIGLKTAGSVAIRWVASSLAMPWDAWNTWIIDNVNAWHLLHGVQLDDPRSSVTPFYVVWWQNESFQSSPVTVVLVLLAVVVIPLLYAGQARAGAVLTYLICSTVGFLSVALVVKYQYYGIRLALGSLLIAVPLVGLMLRRWGRAGIAVAAATVLWATWSSMTSEARPMWGEHSIFTTSREAQMLLYYGPDWSASYRSAAQVVKDLDAKVVGTYHDLAYPLWVLVSAPDERRIVDLDESDRAKYGAGEPEAADVIVCSVEGFVLDQGRCYTGPGAGWTLYSEDAHLRVYVPSGSNLAPKQLPSQP